MEPRTNRCAAKSFPECVEGIEGRLIGYLTYFTASRDDAEDLFQEVCVELHRHRAEVSRMNRPVSWVYRVAHNRAVNRLKRRDTERRALSRRAADPVETEAANGRLGRDELRDAVRESMSRLPADQREAVSLKIWGGRSWVEIGRLLGVSADTAARLCARGLRAVAPSLEGFAP